MTVPEPIATALKFLAAIREQVGQAEDALLELAKVTEEKETEDA